MAKTVNVTSTGQANGYWNHWDLPKGWFDEDGTLNVPVDEEFRGEKFIYLVPKSIWSTMNRPGRDEIATKWNEFQAANNDQRE